MRIKSTPPPEIRAHVQTNFRWRALFRVVRKCALTLGFVTVIASGAAAQTNTFPSSGRVGVGTTAPEEHANIHIYNPPSAGLDIQSSDNAGWSRIRLRTSTRIYGWFAGDASQPDAPNKIGLYDYTAGAFRIMIDSGGKVGIGTSNPAQKLHVFDSSNNGFAAQLEQTNSTASNGLYIKTQTALLADAALHVTANNGAITLISARNNGNVGIGTGSPGYKLDVAGEIRSSSGGYRFPDGTIQTTAATGSGGGSQWVGSSNIYFNGGSVGVGTTNPLALFDVRNTDGFFYAGFGYGANKETFLRAGNSATGVMHIGDMNTQKTLIQEGAGNVGIGTASPQEKLHVAGNIRVDGNINAKYQDVAEWVPSSEKLPAGTVVILDTTKSNQVVSSIKSYDTRVAGVISAQPGITLGEGGEGKLLVATTGRVRVKVDATRGMIQIGDLLVTSDIPGVAMKSKPVSLGGVQLHRPGTIVGKALEPLSKGKGEILVLLSLQ